MDNSDDSDGASRQSSRHNWTYYDDTSTPIAREDLPIEGRPNFSDSEDLDIHIRRRPRIPTSEYSGNDTPVYRERVHPTTSRYSSPVKSRERLREPPTPPPVTYRYTPDYTPSPAYYSRRHQPLEYIPPIDNDGNPLSLDVNILPPAEDENEPGWSNRRTEFASQKPESLSLQASRGYTDEANIEKIILTVDPNPDAPNKATNLRWIHLQQEYMSLKSLENLVTQTPDLNTDEMLLALRLLRQVAEKSEMPYVHGHFLKMTVLRGDSHSTDKAKVKQPDRHCTFVNFPYFAFQVPPAIPRQQDGRLHFPLGLLQTVHFLESTRSRDSEQAICKLRRPNRFGKAIHIPQVWSIVIGSDLLITYSTQSLSSIRGENIEIQRSIARNRSGPSVLRVLDPYQRLLFFSLDLCKTWFELEELVYTQCELGPRNYVKSEFDLFLKDKEILTAAQWPEVLASERSPFIDISVRFKGDGFKSGDSDSDSDPDNYLRRERRSPSKENDLIYSYSRQKPTTVAEPERGTHRFPERRIQSRQESTGGTGHERPKKTATYEEHYSPVSPTRVPDGTAADVGRYDNRGKGKQRDNERTSSDHEEGSSTTLDAAKSEPPDHGASVIAFHIKEGERVIVAEPDSYYSTPDPQSQSNTRANSMSLVVFNQRHGSIQIERPPRPVQSPNTSLPNDSSHPPLRHALPSSRRQSTFRNDHQNTNIGLRQLQNATTPADDHRRHEPVYAYPGLEERRFVLLNRPDPHDRRDSDIPPVQRRHSSYHSYPYRTGRARPSASGIISLATLGAAAIKEVGRDIYYKPKRRKKVTPAINIGGDSQTFKIKDLSPKSVPGRTKHEDGNPQPSNTEPAPFVNLTVNSQDEQKPGSSNSSGPIPLAKAFVLPILMWPTEPAEDLDESPSNNGRNEGHVGAGGNHHPRNSKTGHPPPARSTSNSSNQRQINDSSLVEVLERVYSYLLTDMSGKDDNVFMEMETAHQKDAIFNIAEPRSPSSQNEENADDLPESTQRGTSWYNPSDAGLNSGLPDASTQEHVGVSEYQTRLHQFSTTANRLLEAFVPADYPSPVIGRYYGAVKRIIRTVEDAQKRNTISQLYKKHGTVWIIEDIGDSEYLEKHHLQPLSKPLKDCSKCSKHFAYKHESDALHHILEHHFPSDRLPHHSTALLWIQKHHALSDNRRCDEHSRILRNCSNHLNAIYKGIQEIRDGVCTTDINHSRRYGLPKVLVVAFGDLILFLVYSSHVFDLITKHSESWTSPNWKLLDDHELSDKILEIQDIGNNVEEDVDRGKIDLMLMIRTQDYTRSIKRYEAVGPHYILIMLLSNLQSGAECQNLVDVYKEYVARLSFQVSQHPRRRLLRALKYVEEEIMAISEIMKGQINLYSDLEKVLHPESFRNPTESRVSMYELELELLKKCHLKGTPRLSEMAQLLRRVKRLIEDTKTSVEINDDDHGKAILVFTIVTLVFLPLSFVSSFLGMNTVDIRNQTASQGLYWIISVPLTAGVMIFALVIGYKYEVMRDYIESYMGKVKVKRE